MGTMLNTLLSVKAVFRAEEAKIAGAVEYQSKYPHSIKDKNKKGYINMISEWEKYAYQF